MNTDELVSEARQIRQLPAPSMCQVIRETAGVSRSRLAKALGVDPVTVGRWERGRYRPRGAMLAEYAGLIDALRNDLMAP